ncbi:Rne/Rng family ribonuclease [Sneathiella sp. CAU 1612]|uniref:Ribonuclease E n=1 Tax=Sneathiella sedimenti TaxID=2816034 RepID=A0ABS3F943_9PROT|nr:ribonuclease E/G [Sneathiella sedimenti]MBO0334868.1 Rne/Rng family ribonuclease [Sneathiella sedimenti]
MATRMLIDASHEEETRVVIVKGTRLEEFDYETASRKQLKGNIYLAKVTRVEPSLQAAFVEYGGNRHGFLPFNEIHPDYYQVPISDREVLIEQEAAAEREASDLEDAEIDGTAVNAKAAATDDDDAEETEAMTDSAPHADDDDDDGVVDYADDTGGGLEVVDRGDNDIVENLGGEDDVDDRRVAPPRRNYKIQEVIKRRQILLVQVVKEERGNKGAALTTYISLPGRYSVLMPNTGRGGGISRKISNPADRKRLKKIANELEVPDGIGVIIRTAGLSRTKVEIKRDYEFLMRLWDDIRELTLKSIAPHCVYEEANLIKRSIRDLYDKEISEVLVEGDNGYKLAKDFMRKLMPSHAKKVQPYKDKIPLFHRFQVEQQFASMYHPEVQLKSGGYIVINPTEALVSIDVNSGKATRERNVEDTATKTNLEAAEEIARQLRLRDLAGLIVIDFIDMDDNRNNRAVERRMKDCLKSDRARIQVGRISPFGLMEMSRQRLRPSFLETSTTMCHTCGGSGFVRSIESTALLIIRTLEEEGVRERSAKITVAVHTDVAIYLLNQKRAVIQELENLYGMTILITADPMSNMNDYKIEREKGKPGDLTPVTREVTSAYVGTIDEEEAEKPASESAGEEDGTATKRRRRRRRRKPRDENAPQEANAEEQSGESPAAPSAGSEEDVETGEPKRRRRGKRGGRRRSRNASSEEQQTQDGTTVETNSGSDGSDEAAAIPATVNVDETSETAGVPDVTPEADAVAAPDAPVSAEETEVAEVAEKKPRRSRRKPKSDEVKAEDEASESPETAESSTETTDEQAEAPKKAPVRRRRAAKKEEVPAAEPVESETVAETPSEPASPAPAEESPEVEVAEKPVSVTLVTEQAAEETVVEKKPKRSGWWRRG